MIPQVIHYCWFGGAPLPAYAERCIASWRRHFPGWEIRRWDESNYDVRATPYTSEAYNARKYAFVSDYARFDILHRHGGVYFDTDVEVIRSFDAMLARGPFMGMEGTAVAPGLGIAAEAGHPLLAELLALYRSMHFADAQGRQLPGTVVTHTTDLLMRRGYTRNGLPQTVAGFTIYPPEYLNPFDDITGRLTVTPRTLSIHHYSKSWCDTHPWRTRLSRMAHRWLGIERSARVKRLFRLK